MTEIERIEKEKELRKQLNLAISKGNLAMMASTQQKLYELRFERISLQKAALEGLSAEDHLTAVGLMNRMFVLADLLEGAAVDLEGFMRKAGVERIDICENTRQIKKLAGGFANLVDSFKDEKFSDSFAKLCDEASLCLANIINKQMAKLKPTIYKQHDKG